MSYSRDIDHALTGSGEEIHVHRRQQQEKYDSGYQG